MNAGQLSRKQLRLLGTGGTCTAALLTPGAQIGALAAPPEDEDQDLVTEVLGPKIVGDPRKVGAIIRATREVRRESLKFFESSVAIGRSVNRLRGLLDRFEFSQVIRSSPKLFGLSRSIIVQLMAVADAVDQKLIPQDIAPRSYSIYYQIATLPPASRQLAIDQQVLRPDVTRGEIIAFKKRTAPSVRVLSASNRQFKTERSRKARKAELLRAREQLTRDLEVIEAELRHIDGGSCRVSGC